MLSASPLELGTVYIEEDLGSDLHGDRFEVAFAGGAADTQLTRLVISGDQNAPGFGVGDVFFDTDASGFGADHAMPFQVELLDTQDPTARVTAHVQDGQSLLAIDFYRFQAGDRLVFTIDVDEVVYFDPTQTDLDQINEGFDPITSGVEFQGSHVTAEFVAPDYADATAATMFWNRYDDALQRSGLPLPADDAGGLRDRSTGAFMHTQQLADPTSISGYVYADHSNDGQRDPSEPGIGGVTVQVLPVDTVEPQSIVTLTTDARGFYEVNDLMPGSYRLVEVDQPNGFLDGLDTAGTVDGVVRGHGVNSGDAIEQILLRGGTHGVEYNFGEIAPASLDGNVHLSDRDGNCFLTPGGATQPLADVAITLWDGAGNIVAQTHTNTAGHYSFPGLVPGIYTVTEQTPVGLIDAGASAGRVGPQTRGDVIDDNTIGAIELHPTDRGVDYDFCEHPPSLLSGHVFHDRNNDGERQTGETPIADVMIELFDDEGNRVGTDQTDAAGYYEFSGLHAGSYRLVETQPDAWLDGKDDVGLVDGETRGRTDTNDEFRAIVLGWGATGVRYDFGELQPGSITGRVHADLDHDCVFDPLEKPLADVRIELMDASGAVIATTLTDTRGVYEFHGLVPGTYTVHEIQPDGYFQGSQHAGSHGGNDLSPDLITLIPVGSSESLTDYDFCELPPGSITGIVYVDPNQDESHQPDEQLLAGVVVQLLDAQDTLVATALTDTAGRYAFAELHPGQYAVHELQPAGFFHGGQQVGSSGGDDSIADVISAISIGAGQDLTDYNFRELPPSAISGYVFQDGPSIVSSDGQAPIDLAAVRDGRRTPDDQPIPGVQLELRNGITGQPIDGRQALAGYYPDGPIHTVTDAGGFYQFEGLPRGNYAVFEIHPKDYVDGIDTPGTTSGLAFNPSEPLDITIYLPFGIDPHNDGIIRIPVAPGQTSANNNFSEVKIDRPVVPPLPPSPPPPVLTPPVSTIAPPIAWPANPMGQTADILAFPEYGTADGLRLTWHLSVIDGGTPRGKAPIRYVSAEQLRPVSFLNSVQWVSTSLDKGEWRFAENQGQAIGTPTAGPRFGMPDAIPLSGDFNGDGISETALYFEGQWFIDLNGNGRWDKEDLWARLGSVEDLPVVGDWDGDGKDDIGIFGPEWHGDQRALKAESGLPDPDNTAVTKPKNLPPEAPEATDGHRVLKHTANGAPRLDVIDHVFRFGVSDDIPITGDWNGDGITNIGVFRSGTWYLDLDADGRFTEHDLVIHYGAEGDTPVVGDFNGDGTDEIGIYRRGNWQIDTNGDHKPDAGDTEFQLGDRNARPVVGDWNGDGTDDPAVYRDAG